MDSPSWGPGGVDSKPDVMKNFGRVVPTFVTSLLRLRVRKFRCGNFVLPLPPSHHRRRGCLSPGQPKMWTETQSSRAHIPTPMDVRHIHPTQMKVYTPKSITLGNGDICSAGDWVVWDEIIGQTLHNHIGQVVEIVQVIGSPAYQARKADFVLVMHSIVGEAHEVYKMRRVQPVPTEHQSVQAQVNQLQSFINGT
ncbi:hypothetical protein B0H10DRAFT_1957403 [Mycena sp. CBHHK59/15]|nr:hypothetical protein B0H10DRAFT_1957403 [Mycena sp. CBHHK59/15]